MSIKQRLHKLASVGWTEAKQNAVSSIVKRANKYDKPRGGSKVVSPDAYYRPPPVQGSPPPR